MLLSLAVFMSFTAFAQVLDVASIEKVAMPSYGDRVVTGISPKGDYLLLSGVQLNGLVKYDLATGKSEVLSTALGAGMDVTISADGKNIVYREDKFVNGLRYSDLQQKNLSTGAKTQLLNATRNLNKVDMQGGTAMIVNNGRLTKKVVAKSSVKATAPVASINNRQLMITKDGVTSVLSPNGKQYSYIWPSVSPDGKKVCYFVCGMGCYVSDIDGKNVKEIGILRAAQWVDNNTLVGMHDTDDGKVITSSSIVVKTLNGKSQVLTDDSLVAMYPYASADGKKIVFSTLDGDAYIINVK